jgi:pimeloyl-ACP methyl ester carboxylesterase
MRSLACAALTAAALIAAPTAYAVPAKRVGSVTLHPCPFISGWCGSIPRLLDPGNPHGQRIAIGLRWLPARGGHARGPTLVAVEGGPGFPSIGSRGPYQAMYGPLSRTRNLLLVDNRGTGRSGFIDCDGLQRVADPGGTPGFAHRVGSCARALNRRFAHASDLYSTSYAANDLSAILRRLRLGRVDLYGDSYGTWFAQSFMAGHPNQLHSVILDSAYPVRGLDVWRASVGDASRYAIDAVCSRDLACSSIAPGSATARLRQLLDVVRHQPMAGTTRDAYNSKARVTIGPGTLVDLVSDAGTDPVVYRELDASVRAALAGDPAPLLRLVAQSRSYDHYPYPPWIASIGLYFAISCTDYPQLFDMRASPAARREQLAAAIGTAPDAFGPFTPEEWLQKSSWAEDYYGCLEWPRPVHSAPPLPPDPRPLPKSVPILVLGGDLDNRTPPSDAQRLAPTLGAKARFVSLPNSTHVAAEGFGARSTPTVCARRIVRSFVKSPARLGRLDTRCADAIPPIHTPGSYPLTLADAPAGQLVSGPDPGERARRAATVAANALADAAMRNFYSLAHRSPGLRGGSFISAPGRRGVAEFQFQAVRFVSDATVTGSGSWEMGGNGRFRGDLVVRQGSGPPVRVKVQWDERTRLARASVGDAALELPAP